MEPPTSATFVLKMVEYFGDIDLHKLLKAVGKLEKDTGIRVYDWKIDYEKKLNSKQYWDDIDALNTAGFIELKDNKAEIAGRGKERIKELNIELQENAKDFLEENYWRNLLYK